MNDNLPIYSSGNARAITISLSESNSYQVRRLGANLQRYKLMGSTAFVFLLGDKSSFVSDKRDNMNFSVRGFPEGSLI